MNDIVWLFLEKGAAVSSVASARMVYLHWASQQLLSPHCELLFLGFLMTRPQTHTYRRADTLAVKPMMCTYTVNACNQEGF